MAAAKISRNEKVRLKGKQKKSGFDRWRLVVSGISSMTGAEMTFLLEFYLLNPILSPDEPVLGFKNRLSNDGKDLQFILAGSDGAKNSSSQEFVVPSFLMIRAGILTDRTIINSYYPCADVDYVSKGVIISLDKEKHKECVLGENYTKGVVSVTDKDLIDHPEYMCNTGSVAWNLRIEKKRPVRKGYKSKSLNWYVPSGCVEFTGLIRYNNEDYTVNPKTSFGFYDKNWGGDFANPFLHLNSSFISSEITGSMLSQTSFCVQGEYDGSFFLFVVYNGKVFEFSQSRLKRSRVICSCQESPEAEEGQRLHWNVSAENSSMVVDIDIFCNTSEMFLRDYESPEGERKVMRVLGGSTGYGKICIYKKQKKALELIEQAEIKKCLCEYGNIEYGAR